MIKKTNFVINNVYDNEWSRINIPMLISTNLPAFGNRTDKWLKLWSLHAVEKATNPSQSLCISHSYSLRQTGKTNPGEHFVSKKGLIIQNVTESSMPFCPRYSD